MRLDYSKTLTPSNYVCKSCGAAGCKLWRDYPSWDPILLCVDCAAKDQGKDITSLDVLGLRNSDNGKTDQIGWYVPAIPTEDLCTYWGYTIVPPEGCTWWTNLPNRPVVPVAEAS